MFAYGLNFCKYSIVTRNFLIVGLLEFSVGKFTHFVLNRPFPQEAVLRHISSNATFLLFQVHSQYQNTTVSFTKVSTKDDFSEKSSL